MFKNQRNVIIEGYQPVRPDYLKPGVKILPPKGGSGENALWTKRAELEPQQSTAATNARNS
jgi:hypothetical protein